MRKRFKRGQSLIEVVVSLGVIVVLAVSLISTSLITQKTARTAKNNNAATKLTQESIEKIRVFRDRQGFSALRTRLCLTLDSSDVDPVKWKLNDCAAGAEGEAIELNNTSFNRKIEIDDNGGSLKLVIVTVTWSEPGGIQTVKDQTFLSKWEMSSPSP
ncbi:hypothetical protein A3B51_00285 [Candidatus Curtissbacteria bacterium RIFCSPLOWO2_01_FULL_41_18]|uniref:Type II secretion system protein GspI C-terminal domain-containing protein n=2 Tax=Candidatus Curtissiibacteriota TaxID=1752717 RepID=A0A1F5FZC3_9BACT|nr:MAG: hypothetical protein A2696_02865 [Candidatus Curtissbacteria bacterium RIFCSPHIGHO2_01_FULL_41_13]OGE04619.1 MAG: hypothetical protein A3B51_00285 [Candidatus Curtissbacteria bacterium RIFCSPLOWO2_01_FULL_41_18]